MTTTNDLSILLRDCQHRLEKFSDSPGLDAQVLLAHILKQNKTWVLAHPETRLTHEQLDTLETALQRLEQGEPLPYILGHWEFFGIDFRVTPDVLIPRPETELLVEEGLEWLKRHPARRQVADVGTGSGCIAVALAANNPEINVTAGDISAATLEVARTNARTHGVDKRIRFVQSDMLDALEGAFDCICANLPYIPSTTLQGLSVAKNEPLSALDGGRDGLNAIRRLLRDAPQRLRHGGCVLCEIEASQGPAVEDIARNNFPGADIRVKPDLAGHDRLLCIYEKEI